MPQSSVFRMCNLVAIVCWVSSIDTAPTNHHSHLKSTTDPSDYSIVYDCFYDHSWIIDESHHCHVVAYGAGRKDLSARERVQRKLFQRMIQLDGRDRQLVKHCLLYHQFDLNYDACKGIAWDRPVEPKMRDARLVRLWTKMMTATRREIARSKFFDGDDIALVQTCLYTSQWLTESEHECHRVTYGGGRETEFSARIRKLRQLYRDQRIVDRVMDCHHYHQFDHYEQCYDITWTVKSDNQQVMGDRSFRDTWTKVFAAATNR